MVQPYYDSWLPADCNRTRPETAIKKMLVAMDQFVVEGIKTIPLQRTLLEGCSFRESTFHTRYVDDWLKERNT